MIINKQPFPRIPPIGFFEPISVDPKDMMTDVEYLLGILKKLNTMIVQLNADSEWIENYAGRIEEIEAEVANLRQEMTTFENDINQSIALQFSNIKIELQALVATSLAEARAYTDSIAASLESEIREISIGQISLFDPTTGIYSSLQTVINNIYNSSRENALTATEYDTIDDGDPLTATAYDAYGLTAIEYDQNGKTLLV